MWVMPDDFPLPGNMRESDEQHARQMAFRKRIMGGGERIVSQKGFGSPDLLASEVVERLMVEVVTTDLLKLIRPEIAQPGQAAPSKEEQAPAIAAAVERLAEDKDVDLLAMAKDPKGIDVAELEAKLMAREKELEAEARGMAAKRAEYWRHIGALAFLQDTHKALAAYKQAVDLDEEIPDGWRYLGELHYRVGDYASARIAFERLRKVGENTSNLRAQSKAALRLNWIERQEGNLNEAEHLADKALWFAQCAEWPEGIAHAYGNLGIICQLRGDFQRAEEIQTKALDAYEELGGRDGLAREYGNLGVLYQKRGQLGQAEEMHLQSLKVFEELSNKEGMARAYVNLGVIYQARGDLDRAEEMQLKALKLTEELGHKEGMAIAYGNLGVMYQTRGDLDRAEEMQFKALKLYEEPGSKEGMARAYGNLGIIYQTRGDLVRAEEMQLKALKLYEELGSKEGMANAYSNLGNIYAARGDKARMCECWRKERDLWRAMGLEDKAAEAEKRLLQEGCGEGDGSSEPSFVERVLGRFRRN